MTYTLSPEEDVIVDTIDTLLEDYDYKEIVRITKKIVDRRQSNQSSHELEEAAETNSLERAREQDGAGNVVPFPKRGAS